MTRDSEELLKRLYKARSNYKTFTLPVNRVDAVNRSAIVANLQTAITGILQEELLMKQLGQLDKKK